MNRSRKNPAGSLRSCTSFPGPVIVDVIRLNSIERLDAVPLPQLQLRRGPRVLAHRHLWSPPVCANGGLCCHTDDACPLRSIRRYGCPRSFERWQFRRNGIVGTASYPAGDDSWIHSSIRRRYDFECNTGAG